MSGINRTETLATLIIGIRKASLTGLRWGELIAERYWVPYLTRIFHQFLLRRRKFVCGLRDVLAHDYQRVRNTPSVVSFKTLDTHQLGLPRGKTGEISGLTPRSRSRIFQNNLTANFMSSHYRDLLIQPVGSKTRTISWQRWVRRCGSNLYRYVLRRKFFMISTSMHYVLQQI